MNLKFSIKNLIYISYKQLLENNVFTLKSFTGVLSQLNFPAKLKGYFLSVLSESLANLEMRITKCRLLNSTRLKIGNRISYLKRSMNLKSRC